MKIATANDAIKVATMKYLIIAAAMVANVARADCYYMNIGGDGNEFFHYCDHCDCNREKDGTVTCTRSCTEAEKFERAKEATKTPEAFKEFERKICEVTEIFTKK